MGYRVKPFTMAVRDNSTQQFIDVGLLGSDVGAEIQDIKDRIIKHYDTVASMKADRNLAIGDYVRTGSYYHLNDGGGALYIVTNELSNLHMETLANGLYARIVYEDAVRPECLGATGDGQTDDTTYFQEACDDAYIVQLPVVVDKTYLLTETINVPNKVTIKGSSFGEYQTPINVASDIGVVFNCGVQNYFEHLIIITKTREYADVIAFQFNGDSSHNIDATLFHVSVTYAEKGVYIRGRNVNIFNCLFSHCRYGVHLDIPSGVGQVRGIVIENSRFHGIGEEYEDIDGVQTEMIKSGNCAGILLDADLGESIAYQLCDVVIQNNVSDQSGAFIKGNCPTCLISGNYIKHFEQPAIITKPRNAGSALPTGMGSWHIVGNYIYGVKGNDGAGEAHNDYPAYAIKLDAYGRANIVANDIGSQNSVFDINNAYLINIISNYFVPSGTTAIGLFRMVTGMFGFNVLSSNSDISLFHSNSNNITGLTIRSNSPNIKVSDTDSMTIIGSEFNSGSTNSDVTKYNRFFIRRTDGASMWEVRRFNTYYSSTPIINSTGTIDYIEITSNNTVSVKRRAVDGTITTLVVPLYLMVSNI